MKLADNWSARKAAVLSLLTTINSRAESIGRAIDDRYGTLGGYTDSEMKEIAQSLISIQKRLDKIREKL